MAKFPQTPDKDSAKDASVITRTLDVSTTVVQGDGGTAPSGGMPAAETQRPGSHDSAVVVTNPVVRGDDQRTVRHEPAAEPAAPTAETPAIKPLRDDELEPNRGDFDKNGSSRDTGGNGKTRKAKLPGGSLADLQEDKLRIRDAYDNEARDAELRKKYAAEALKGREEAVAAYGQPPENDTPPKAGSVASKIIAEKAATPSASHAERVQFDEQERKDLPQGGPER